MSVTFENYQKGDVLCLNIRDGDFMGDTMMDYPFPAWTMRVDNDVAACGGIMMAGKGVANVWFFVGDKARGHGLALTRFARSAAKKMIDVLEIHRFQTIVRADRPEYERWAALFGFEKESVMRKASPTKDDLFLFARII